VTNDILALDRGNWRPPRKNDDHKYIVKKLSTRTNQEDFNFLPQHVKAMYDKKLEMHEALITQQAQELAAAEAGFIPSGGYQVAMDYYVTEPGGDPNKTRRVRVPSESVAWLLEKLQKQGQQMSDLTSLPPGATQDIAGQLAKGRPPMPPGAAGPAASGQQGQNSIPHGMVGAMNNVRSGIGTNPGTAPPIRIPGLNSLSGLQRR
jgi:hypothetical protein